MNTKMFSAVMLSMGLAGCNGQLAGTELDSATSVSKAVAGSGCSVTQTGSGASITCQDGSTATVQNITVTPQYRARANGVVAGRVMGSSSGNGSLTLVDDSEHMFATYSYSSILQSTHLYYTDAGCATAPLQYQFMNPNEVFSSVGVRYKMGSTTGTTFASVIAFRSSTTGVCAAWTIPLPAYPMAQVVPYTGSLPLTLSAPVTIETF